MWTNMVPIGTAYNEDPFRDTLYLLIVGVFCNSKMCYKTNQNHYINEDGRMVIHKLIDNLIAEDPSKKRKMQQPNQRGRRSNWSAF